MGIICTTLITWLVIIIIIRLLCPSPSRTMNGRGVTNLCLVFFACREGHVDLHEHQQYHLEDIIQERIVGFTRAAKKRHASLTYRLPSMQCGIYAILYCARPSTRAARSKYTTRLLRSITVLERAKASESLQSC
jgi:hypothetical protein